MTNPLPRSPWVISLGEVLWDLFPDRRSFGGAPANFACHAAALGLRASILSAVGEDANGCEARKILTLAGVDTALLQEIEGGTTGSVGVGLDAAAKPLFTIHSDAAWDRIAWSPQLAAHISAADAVYFGTLAQRSAQSRETIHRALAVAREAGIPRVLDVNLREPFHDPDGIRESITRCSILKLSDEEFPAVTAACGIPTAAGTIAALRELLHRHDLRLVAMTRGADGALLVSSDEAIEQAAFPVEVCDTVGAGDAFTAALVAGLLAGAPLADIARTACEHAARVCSRPGAFELPGQPPARAFG